jgi:hypothetical protein
MNEHEKIKANVRYMTSGKNYMDYDEWCKNFNSYHFYSLVDEGIRPLIEPNYYYINMETEELGDRIAFWCWEIYAHTISAGRYIVESLVEEDQTKSEEQYINYLYNVNDESWNRAIDDWENSYLFNVADDSGRKQRELLPDFLWKLIDDQNYSSDYYESNDEEEVVEKRKETSISELGWITNNRRNF